MVAGEKRAIRGVGPIYRVTWCRMVFFCAAPLYSIAYTQVALYRRAGLFHFRFSDLCHTVPEILSSRKAKAKDPWFGPDI